MPLNGKNVKPALLKGGDIEKISKNIRKAVDVFLGKNADVFGVAYVSNIIMSKDHREARIFVYFKEDPIRGKKLLDKKKREVSQTVNSFIKMKFPPRIKIEGVSDEAINI